MKKIPPKFHFFILQFIFVFSLNAQNLVPNNSFEDFSQCPTTLGQIFLATGWNTPTGTSSDYFNSCNSGNVAGVPVNIPGVQTALTGEGYAGIVVYHASPLPFYREYIQAELTEPLEAGFCYEIEMYTSAAETWARNGISHLGLYLSATPPTPDQNGQILVTPQAFYQNTVLDTENWVLLSGTYTAVGGEQYITIGNFFENGTFNIELLDPPNDNGTDAAYYYIEDVRVEQAGQGGEQDIEVLICEGECYEFEGELYCEEGTYEIESEGGCAEIINLTIIFDEAAIVDIASPDSLGCNTISVILDASGSSSGSEITYQWTGPNNFSSDIQNPEVFDPGVYTLVVSGSDLCPSEGSIEVIEHLVFPDVSTEVSGIIDCNNPVVTLTGSTNNSNVTYQWTGPGMDSDLPSVTTDQSGTYTFSVTTIGGCTSSEELIVEEDLELPDIFAEVQGVLDCNTSSVILFGNSTTPGVTYIWAGPGVDSNDPVVSTNQGGEYTFAVIAPNGCVSTANVTVIEDTEPPDIFAEVQGVLDCNNSSVVLFGFSATPGATYVWSGPGVNSNDPVTSTDQAGVYTFFVLGPNGCTSSTDVTVEEDTGDLDIDANVDGILNCENTTVTLTGSTSTPGVTYQWIGPNVLSEDSIIQVDEAGDYTFSIIADNGCSIDTSILVEQNVEAPQVIIITPDTIDCNTVSVDLDAGNSNGNGPLSFVWQNDVGDTLGDSSLLTVDTSGVYTLMITDEENGCSAQSNIEVYEDTEAVVSTINVIGELNCINNLVTLDGSSSSGSSLEFEWMDSVGTLISTDTSLEISVDGTYQLLVSNTSNGCTALTSVEIESDFELPTVFAQTEDSLNCITTEAILSGSGSSIGSNISYEWQNSQGDSINNELQFIVESPGVYTLIVLNEENGCSSLASVELYQDIESPVAIAGDDQQISCDEPELILDGSASSISNGTLIFQWTNSNNEIISNSETVDVTTADIYTLTVIAENGCSSSDTLEVAADTNIPIADAGLGDTLDCELSVITIGGSGTSTGNDIIYEWQYQTGTVIATTSSTDVNLPGIYTLIVTDSSNSCSSLGTIEILQDIESPISNAGSSQTLNCQITEVQLDGSQSSNGQLFSYQWLDSNGDLISEEINTSVDLPDTYTLIVTNMGNSCTALSTVIIDQNIDTPIADAGEDGTLNCSSTAVTLDGSASSGNNLSFEWYNESGTLVGNQSNIEVSETGTFTLVVTDTESFCSSQSTVEVIPDDNLPTAIATPDGVLNCITTEVFIDGSASTSVSGNIGYEWLDEGGNALSIDENIIVSTPGIYTLIVTDTDNNCSISTTVEIQQDVEPPVADAGENQILTCSQTQITLDGSGSIGQNLSFEWQDELGNTIALTAITTVSSGGAYFLFVTNNNNGCVASASVEIIPDVNLPVADAGNDQLLTCSIDEITLDGSNSSTGPSIEYEWQNSSGDIIATSATAVIDQPGTYTLIVLDTNNNCQTQDQVIVDEDVENPTATIDFVSNQEIDCNNSSIVLDATGSAPFGSLSFEWSTNDGEIVLGGDSPNPEMGQAGTYTLTVTNSENGCTDSETIEVVENFETPVVTINTPQILTCDNVEIMLNAICTSVGSLTFVWTTSNGIIVSGEDSLVATVVQPGDYTITVINNDNGCETFAQTTVFQDIIPPTAIANADEQFDCVTESITLSGEGSSVGPEFTYQWFASSIIDNGTTLFPTIYEPGTYTLEVTNDENGCTQTAAVVVPENENAPTAAQILVTDPLCFGQTGSLSILTVTGGSEPYLYSIDGGQNFSPSNSFSSLEGGTYAIIIQDALGCEYEETIIIQEAVEIYVELEPEVILQLGQDYQISAFSNVDTSQIAQIIWSPTEGLSCTNCLNPKVDSLLHETQYTLTIINHNGCQATDRIMLRVDKTREIFIPNAFSPTNQDGVNDVFMIFANNDKIRQVNTFQVYDRWGEQIFVAENFQPNDPVYGWNGKLNDEKLNPAVFVYFAEIEFIDGVKIIYKGDVTLME